MPQHATHANEPRDIAWFDGSLQGAFIVAKRENRPVLIYWGAEWCPFCHTLKSKVFSRPDFIAKSHLFLPVYLDGDDDGAQKWGEQFGIQGYPTLIVLDPDRHEIIRLGAGRDVAQYAAIARHGARGRAAGRRVAQVRGRRQRSSATNAGVWPTTPGSSTRSMQTAMAAQPTGVGHCRQRLSGRALQERASLNIYRRLLRGQCREPRARSARRQALGAAGALTDQVAGILAQRELAVASADALQRSRRQLLQGGARARPKFALAAARQLCGDDGLPRPTTRATSRPISSAPRRQLRALKAFARAEDKLPADVVAAANMRIDAALDGGTESVRALRTGQCFAEILEDTGQYFRRRTRSPRPRSPRRACRTTSRPTWRRSPRRWARRTRQ